MIEKMIEYQTVDAQLKSVEQELSSNEDRKKGIAAKKFLDTVNDSLTELDGKAAELEAAFNKYQSTYKKLSETQKEFEGTIEEYSEEDELNFVKKKARELLNELASLEQQATRLAEEIEAVTEQYKTLKKKTASAQKQFRECGQRYTEFKASKAEIQKEITGRLAEIEKEIPPEVMAIYKQKRAEKMFPILFEYTGSGYCPHCRTEFSKLAESKLSKNNVVICDNCGRVLYKK